MSGFVYNFYIDLGFYAKGDPELHYGNTGCLGCGPADVCTEEASECLTGAYDCTADGGDSDCWKCYDPMCMQCNGFSSASECATGKCHDFSTEASNECTCGSLMRMDPVERCFDCGGECDDCGTQDQPFGDSIVYCILCKSGKKEISLTSGAAEYKYCIDDCPHGFTENAGTCTLVTSLTLEYDFNVPSETYRNLVDDSLIAVGANGYPAIYRGYYINDASAHILIQNLVLNQSWSVHAWILIKGNNTNKFNTVFSKDRGDFGDGIDSNNMIRCGVDQDDTGNLTVEWTRDNSANFKEELLDQSVGGAWRYVVYSFENEADASATPYKTQRTKVIGYVNNVASTPVYYNRYFMNDKSSYNLYIGNYRTAASTFDEKLNGFIYNFYLYQGAATGNEQYSTGVGCFDGPGATSCWTVDFDKYSADGSTETGTCDASCTGRGCRDSATCIAQCGSSGNEAFCHLCHDKLCTDCDTYTSCESDKCKTNAEDDGASACKCSSGYVREPDTNEEVCNDCYGECATCVASTTGNYSDCTACLDTHWSHIFATDKTWCFDFCPTGYDGSGQPTCTESVATNIATWTFTDSSGYTSNGNTVTPTGTDPSPVRGFYFADTSTYVDISSMRFSFTFTVSSWTFFFDVS